ncbi:hypothetical protein KD146_13850 [Devosia sp. BSSL-BM10]|uniref:Uncharacterized protein n=1 Tax=Devosia litorisediminis TaxID=2829817 RepID=A0A942E810_9HYPH|nr:hypothetical protein [Devosia litorisediminis]MBS3849783.1 hypothetical protein [Devosia litorisediminis]
MMASTQRQALVRARRKGDEERRRKAQILAREILRRGKLTPEITHQLRGSTPDMKHLIELLAHPLAAFLIALPPKLRPATLAVLVSLVAVPVAITGLIIADIVGAIGWPN